jgi:phosphatidylserine/phosphatidylglycerophosphate/cardiolipin synthase-like enzyme
MNRLSKRNKLLTGIAIIAVTIAGTYFISQIYFVSEFHVIYSLDAKQNDQEIISVIDRANKYVYFAIYTFTKSNIADALVRAKKRGLVVWGIVDKSQAESGFENTVLKELADAGIPVETQKHQDGIMHIKAVVTDNEYAFGSYNWTESATTVNDEILEVGSNNALRLKYLAIIQKLLLTNQ